MADEVDVFCSLGSVRPQEARDLAKTMGGFDALVRYAELPDDEIGIDTSSLLALEGKGGKRSKITELSTFLEVLYLPSIDEEF